MSKLIAKLFDLVIAVARIWIDRQAVSTGRAVQREADMREVITREEKAKDAVATPDPARDERLRNRFDRSRR